MDTAFESTHGADWSIFTAVSIAHASHDNAVVLHQQTPGKFMIWYEKTNMFIKTYEKADCSFEVKSAQDAGSSGNMFITLLDQNAKEFYIFQFQTQTLQKVSFVSRSTSPYFNWIERLTDVVTNS